MMDSERPELRATVHKHPVAIFILQICVEPRHRNIVNSQVRLMASAQRKLLAIGHHCMNKPRRILLDIQTLQNDIGGRLVVRPGQIDEVPEFFFIPEGVSEMFSAEFALEGFPRHGVVVVGLL